MARGVAVVLCCAAIAGCGGDGEPVATTGADELVASCGAVAFDTVPADPSSFPALGAEQAELDLTSIEGEDQFFDEYTWLVAARTDTELTIFGQATRAGVDPPYGGAHLRREGDRWVPDSWGQCRIEITAPGWGTARFELDPNVAPDPEATTLPVLANETACASGRAPEGREVRAVIAESSDSSISIVVLVEPPTGDQDCPSNPPFRFEVDLGEPLGERSVIDASVQPGIVVR